MPIEPLGYYVAAMIFGGVFLALSLLGLGNQEHADDGGEAPADGDADGGDHADAGSGDDAHDHHDHHANAPFAGDGMLWFPVASMRFWVFALTFGGLTGALLEMLTPEWSHSTTLAAVLGMGYLTGASAVNLLRAARRGDVSSAMSTRDMIGLEGEVILPVGIGVPGKIRVATRSGVEEFQALAAEGTASLLQPHSRVVIAGFRQHRAVVRAVATGV